MVLSRAGDAKRKRVIHRPLEFDIIVLKVVIVRFYVTGLLCPFCSKK